MGWRVGGVGWRVGGGGVGGGGDSGVVMVVIVG